GHPVGATGTRLIITMLNALRQRNKNSGLVTLCIGGGQGAALALEVE
ncbi:MAG: acetyl-CoA acetyltransferase, partial [Psychromonas sp.]